MRSPDALDAELRDLILSIYLRPQMYVTADAVESALTVAHHAWALLHQREPEFQRLDNAVNTQCRMVNGLDVEYVVAPPNRSAANEMRLVLQRWATISRILGLRVPDSWEHLETLSADLPGRSFQISLDTVAYACLAVAIFGLRSVWDGGFSNSAILAAALFVAAFDFARGARSPNLAWGAFCVAWCLALFDIGSALMGQMRFSWDRNTASVMRQGLLDAYACGVMLPLILTVPLACMVCQSPAEFRLKAWKWLPICPIVGLIDVTALAFWLMHLTQHLWPAN